ncbi:hypothetical protein DRJ17_00740 [Candidatus Woesearchaeota archaeon]|nr:MAG: hypothetical protein DRJ17_00740 [Candidatus Woesearchaeota archaeon]
MFEPDKLSKRDKRILKALLYFYPRKKSAAQIHNYISKYWQKSGIRNAKALGHILMRFPVDSELTVISSVTKTGIINSRYLRIYVLKKNFVKKYYKEKNDLIKLGNKKSRRSSKAKKDGRTKRKK